MIRIWELEAPDEGQFWELNYLALPIETLFISAKDYGPRTVATLAKKQPVPVIKIKNTHINLVRAERLY